MLVWVFDGDFDAGGVGEEGFDGGGVEVATMPCTLVRGEDQELGDAASVR